MRKKSLRAVVVMTSKKSASEGAEVDNITDLSPLRHPRSQITIRLVDEYRAKERETLPV